MARDARLLAGVAFALCVAVGAASSASGQALPGNPLLIEHWNGAEWEVTHGVAPRSGSELRAVTAISPTNLWAVGSRASVPLAEHYHGKSWSPVVVPTPNRKGSGAELIAVSATSAKDVWAVGSIGPHTHTLIEHFNGTAWKVVPSPRVVGYKLMSIAALTRRNAWAVGSLRVRSKNSRPLIEHWNGSSWRRVASPNPSGPEDELLAISARSARDIWAVGDHRAAGRTRALVLHWNGDRWMQVASPSHGGSLWGVAAIGAKDVWAVGEGGTRPMAEHWNGRAWRGVSVRLPVGSSAINSYLWAVSALSSTDVWAVGQDLHKHKALIEHWDGHAWTPSPAAGEKSLFGIAAVSASNVWAVGSRTPHIGLR